MKRAFHHTSHLGKMNADRFVSAPPKLDPKREAELLREEIKKANSWILFYSGTSARKRMSKDYCQMQIEAYERVIAKHRTRLAAIAPAAPKTIEVGAAVEALKEVANMTPEEEARLNQAILDAEAK